MIWLLLVILPLAMGVDDVNEEEEVVVETLVVEQEKPEQTQEIELNQPMQQESLAIDPTTVQEHDMKTTNNEIETNTISNKTLSSFRNVTNSTSSSFNATDMALSACEKIEYSVLYVTSLDFDESFFQVVQTKRQSKFWFDVYLIQIIAFPTSLALAFFGSKLLLPACTMTAAALGVFVVFHFVNNYFRGGLDCQMKLALSGVSAALAAMGAAAFVRFGLFALGTFSAGLGAYSFFDAFPDFDPGNVIDPSIIPAMTDKVAESSDISPYAWIVVIFLAVCGGLFLRLYEEFSLEAITAICGGVGVSYCAHTVVIIQGGVLDRSIVFLIATAIAGMGWRFQRRRRLNRLERIPLSPYRDYSDSGTLPHTYDTNFNRDSWRDLQRKIDVTHDLLAKNRQMDDIASELSDMLNSFQDRIKERSKQH